MLALKGHKLGLGCGLTCGNLLFNWLVPWLSMRVRGR